MSITTKDLNLLAEAFASTHENAKYIPEKLDTWYECLTSVMDALAQSNPRFDREKFIQATEN